MPDSTNLKPAAQPFDRQAAAAFVSYMTLSLLIFGRGLLANPADAYLGRGPDALLNIWFFAWWAHAISHHLNPFLTTAIWAPSGVNIAWTTNFPLASCLLYPVTRLYGPIVSCNVAHLVGLATRRMVRVRTLSPCRKALLAGVGRRMPVRFFALHADLHGRWWAFHAGVLDSARGLGDVAPPGGRAGGSGLRGPPCTAACRAISAVGRNFRHRHALWSDRDRACRSHGRLR